MGGRLEPAGVGRHGVLEQRQGRILVRLDRPQRLAPVEPQRAEGVGLGQPDHGRPPQARPPLQLLQGAVGLEPGGDDPDGLRLGQALDLPQAQPDRGHQRPAPLPRLQRAVPMAVIDVDRADLDAVVDGIADQLRRGVEAHRLGVEDGGTEHVRVVALEPGRDVDQEREAGRVALREAVIAEALDLLEAGLGEVLVVAAAHHAAHQLAVPLLDLAGAPERRHRAPEPVGLGRREARGDDGDLHRLLLEQRHAQGLAQHLGQLRPREHDRLQAVAAAQIGVDHVALDRPRADDRHLDHQVVEGARA